MGALMKRSDTHALFNEKAARAAHTLFQAVYSQSCRKPTFFSLMMFKIQQMSWQVKADQNSLDYQYWRDQGWFNPKQTYYIPHEAGWLKVALARMAGVAIAKIMA